MCVKQERCEEEVSALPNMPCVCARCLVTMATECPIQDSYRRLLRRLLLKGKQPPNRGRLRLNRNRHVLWVSLSKLSNLGRLMIASRKM